LGFLFSWTFDFWMDFDFNPTLVVLNKINLEDLGVEVKVRVWGKKPMGLSEWSAKHFWD
jgi:hypothetical protein